MKKNIKAYYNEWDKHAAAWLRQLIEDGLITDGVVDERSITEVIASDIRGFDRVHWFAGIGTWDYCLNEAGWGDRPIWTASLPCQPFSAAGKQLGKEDERHLLPHFLGLVRECKPDVIFGEQVSRAINVTGQLRNQDKDLQLLQKKQAYIRVLSELQRSSGKGLRGMQEFGEIKKEASQGRKLIQLSELEKNEQRECVSKCCKAQSKSKGHGIGYYAGMGSRENRFGILRSNWHSVRPGYAESVECPISGQNKQQHRVHEGEHESCHLCVERDDEYLGRAEDFSCIRWDHEAATEEIRRAYRILDEQIEGSVSRGWLDDLHAEMEAQNYAVGHIVFGAHSIGAAHIRQRLYWVAHSISKGLQGHGQSGIEQIQERRERTQRHSAKGGDASGMGITYIDGCKQGSETTKAARYRNTVDAAGWVDWLYCRDEKHRPIKSGSIKMAHGFTSGMVCCCNKSEKINEEEREINGHSNQTNSREILPVLQQENGEKENKYSTRGLICFQKTEILQQGLYGQSIRRGDEGSELKECSQAIIQDGKGELRGVWKNNFITCPSCGRKSYEQLAIEFDDIVLSMPQGGTLETFFCSDGASFLQTLRKTSNEEQPLLDSQYPLSEVWRSLNDEEKNRVRVAFSERAWIISEGIKPLVNGSTRTMGYSSDQVETEIKPNETEEAHAMRLKGYGNAIVSGCAIEFIKTFMEYQN